MMRTNCVNVLYDIFNPCNYHVIEVSLFLNFW